MRSEMRPSAAAALGDVEFNITLMRDTTSGHGALGLQHLAQHTVHPEADHQAVLVGSM